MINFPTLSYILQLMKFLCEKGIPFGLSPPQRPFEGVPPGQGSTWCFMLTMRKYIKPAAFVSEGRERTGTDVLSIIREGKCCESKQGIGYYTVALVICLHRLLSIGRKNHLQNESQQSGRYAHEYER